MSGSDCVANQNCQQFVFELKGRSANEEWIGLWRRAWVRPQKVRRIISLNLDPSSFLSQYGALFSGAVLHFKTSLFIVSALSVEARFWLNTEKAASVSLFRLLDFVN